MYLEFRVPGSDTLVRKQIRNIRFTTVNDRKYATTTHRGKTLKRRVKKTDTKETLRARYNDKRKKQKAVEVKSDTKACGAGKEINPASGRCRKKCGNHQHRVNGRCRLKRAAASGSRSPSPSLPRRKKSSPAKTCPPGKEYNMETKRCRKKCSPDQHRINNKGRCIIREVIKKKKKTTTPKACGVGKERNPESGRCRKICGPDQYRLNNKGPCRSKLTRGIEAKRAAAPAAPEKKRKVRRNKRLGDAVQPDRKTRVVSDLGGLSLGEIAKQVDAQTEAELKNTIASGMNRRVLVQLLQDRMSNLSPRSKAKLHKVLISIVKMDDQTYSTVFKVILSSFTDRENIEWFKANKQIPDLWKNMMMHMSSDNDKANLKTAVDNYLVSTNQSQSSRDIMQDLLTEVELAETETLP